MVNNAGTADSVPSSASSVRDNASVKLPWPLIAACTLVIMAIVTCVIYLFVHLLDQDKILFRIDQKLCTVAIHDAKVDRNLASKAHVQVKIEIPIDCSQIHD